VRARKYRAQDRSVYEIHEDMSTELTLQSQKNTIKRVSYKLSSLIFRVKVFLPQPNNFAASWRFPRVC